MEPEVDNDQNALSAEEMAQMQQMQEADNAAPAAPAAAPAAPAPKKDDKQPTASEKKDDKAKGAEGEGEQADGDKAAGKQVPLAALHEARAETKELREELKRQREQSEANMAKVMDRFEATLKALAPKPEEPKPEPVPDFETDPAGWIQHQMKTSGKELDEVKKELEGLRTDKARQVEQDKERGAVQSIMNYAIAAETQFISTTPDYWDASKFLVQSRTEELAEMGYSEQQVQAMINAERLAIAYQAQQTGKNPAEIAYKMSVKRGYKKAETPPPNDQQQQQQQVQQQQPSAEDQARQRIEATKGGQQQSQSLSDTRGNTPSPLTAQRLLEMSEAEFARVMNTPEGKALMGA